MLGKRDAIICLFVYAGGVVSRSGARSAVTDTQRTQLPACWHNPGLPRRNPTIAVARYLVKNSVVAPRARVPFSRSSPRLPRSWDAECIIAHISCL